MPALNEGQRKRQRMLQKQREEAFAASMRPKPGQKGQQTGAQGAASKGETIGGAPQRVRVKNPVKSKQLTADEARTPKVEAGKSDPEFRRPTPADKKPATPPVKATAQRTTAMPASRMTPPIPKPKQETKAAAQSYRDKEDTKGLSVGRYRTLAEHRAAVAKQKGAAEPSTKADSQAMQISGTLKAMGISPKTGVPDLNAKDAVTPESKKKKKK